MPPTITGTENEYCVRIQRHRQTDYERYDESMYDLFQPPPQAHIDQFFVNGSRLYNDYGNHIEYATPEDTLIEGTVANEIAGERIVFRGLQARPGVKKPYNFTLNKRVIDDRGNTWGHHENFLVPRDKVPITKVSLGLLGVHLATVGVMTGAGAILLGRGTAGRYVMSQKIMDLEDDFSNATTNDKPLVNLRDEPHASKEWSRVHVTSGDANMSPWAMRMRLGTISLVLQLIEHGSRVSNQLRFAQPLHQVAQAVSRDLSMRETIELTNRKTTHPLAVQAELIGAARELAEEVELSNDLLVILNEWERAHNDLLTRPESLADRVDWIAKGQLLEQYRQRFGLDWGHEKLRAVDKLWDNLGPQGIGQRRRQGIWQQWMPPETLIADREINPPTTTRAALRGRFIRRFAADDRKPLAVTWSYVSRDSKNIFLDPHENTNEEVEALLSAA